MNIDGGIGYLLDNVFQEEQVHIMPSPSHQRGELEEGFFSTAAPKVGNNQSDLQVRGSEYDGGSACTTLGFFQ